jgi:hypothetical protein
MSGVLKKSVLILVIVFLGFWLVQDPNGFALSAREAGSGIWDLLVQLFDGIIRFFRSITS